MEESCLDAYSSALQQAEPNQLYISFVHKGLACGIAVCSEQWVRGLQFWFGAWLLYISKSI